MTFKLSEKIKINILHQYMDIEDVKEFIKLLKEGLRCNAPYYEDNIELIDELAGKDLI